MSKFLLIAVYDVKAGAYNNPVPMLSKAAAIRSFGDALKDEKSDFSRHPEDYSLVHVGDWDSVSGEIKAIRAPERIITALECLPAIAA